MDRHNINYKQVYEKYRDRGTKIALRDISGDYWPTLHITEVNDDNKELWIRVSIHRYFPGSGVINYDDWWIKESAIIAIRVHVR